MNPTSHRAAFNSLGWLIPPYVQIRYLDALEQAISNSAISSQDDLEKVLAPMFSPGPLAAMVCERYPITPFVCEYKEIIAEAVEAHFCGLGHVAISGLNPVIEGVGLKLLASRGLPPASGIKGTFNALADDCSQEVQTNNIGNVAELVEMFESFKVFTAKYFYEQSASYPLTDNTNRHGILHGAFTDAEYGRPIGFYKVASALNFLCMISALRAHISWLAPNETSRSQRLAAYYIECFQHASKRPPLP